MHAATDQDRTHRGRWTVIQISCVLLLLVLTACTPETNAYKDFVESAKRSAKPEVLQEQIVSLLTNYNNAGSEVPVSELPAEVKKLSAASPPNFAFVVGQQSSEKALMIAWGNGFAHWGVIVGPSSFEMPKESGETTTWVPGVFFFFW